MFYVILLLCSQQSLVYASALRLDHDQNAVTCGEQRDETSFSKIKTNLYEANRLLPDKTSENQDVAELSKQLLSLSVLYECRQQGNNLEGLLQQKKNDFLYLFQSSDLHELGDY